MKTEKPHVWYRIEPNVQLLILIIIPFCVWIVTSHSEREKLHLEYVRLAIGILQPTKKDKQPQKELRSWAVQVLADSSPVKLSPATTQALIDGESNLPRVNVYTPYTSSYSDYTPPFTTTGGDYSPPFTSSGGDYNPKKPSPTPNPK